MGKILSRESVSKGTILVCLEHQLSYTEQYKECETIIKRMFTVENISRKTNKDDPTITHAISITRIDGKSSQYMLEGELENGKIKIRMDYPAKRQPANPIDIEQKELISYIVTDKKLSDKEQQYVNLSHEIEENQKHYSELVFRLGEAKLSDDEAGVLQKLIRGTVERLLALNWDTHLKMKELTELGIVSPKEKYRDYMGIESGMFIKAKNEIMLVLEKAQKTTETLSAGVHKSRKDGDTFICMSANGTENIVFTSQNYQLEKDATISILSPTETCRRDLLNVMIERLCLQNLSHERLYMAEKIASDPYLCENVKNKIGMIREQINKFFLSNRGTTNELNFFLPQSLKEKTSDTKSAELLINYPRIINQLNNIEIVADRTIETYGLDIDYGAGVIPNVQIKNDSKDIEKGKTNDLAALLNHATIKATTTEKTKNSSKEEIKDYKKMILKEK